MIIIKIIAIALVLILGISIMYTFAGFLCSIIPKNKSYKNHPKDVEVYLVSDGIHTDFLVPCMNAYFNWKNIIDDRPYQLTFDDQTFLSLGWGDRGFYLDIPTWGDLTFKVAARAMLIPSKTVMHVTAHDHLPKDKKYLEKIHLSRSQYLLLCKYISSYFEVQQQQIVHIPNVGYTENDEFYNSTGSYHAFNTCNFWVNKGLILIGVRMPIWSHWAKGLFYQLRKAQV